MKRTVILVICLFLALMALASCNTGGTNENDSEALRREAVEKINAAMESCDSFEAHQSLQISLFYLGEQISVSGEAQFIYAKEDDGGIYYYSSTESEIAYASEVNKTSVLEAFNDGVYFYSTAADGKNKNRLRSEHTDAEFIEYLEKYSAETGILDKCSEFSAVENEDKTLTLTFSKYSADVTAKLNQSYGFPMENGGGKISDLVLTVKTNADYLISEITMDYVFTNSSFVGTQKTVITNHGAAEKVLDTIEPKRFFLVDDAMAVSMLNNLLNGAKADADGSFIFGQSQKIEALGASSTVKERSDIKYGVDENGKYFFSADSLVNGEEVTITYEDGLYLLNGDEMPKYNDFSVKAQVDSMVDPFSFSAVNIKIESVKKTVADDSTVTYDIELNTLLSPMEERIKAVFKNLGVGYTSMNVSLRFSVKDGELLTMAYEIEGSGYLRNGNSTYGVGLDINTLTDFATEIEEGEPDA